MKIHKLLLPSSKNTLEQLEDLKKHYWDKNSFHSKAASSYWKIWQEETSFNINYDDNNPSVEFGGTLFGDYEGKKSLINKTFDLPKILFNRKLKAQLSSEVLDALNEACDSMNREVSYDCLKQALSLMKIKDSGISLDDKTICIIGDGYGFLGVLIKKLCPNSKLVCINLGRILTFDLLLTSTSVPEANLNVASGGLSYNPEADFNFIPAEVVDSFEIQNIDLFINIASMQEMDLQYIRKYMSLMRSQRKNKTFFYCCNRVTKTLPDNTVINFADYGWKGEDTILIDESCKWYKTAPMSRPPFIKHFDGEVWRRLALLKTH